MASRRKASTPCMIRPGKTLVEPDDETEESQNMETTMESQAEEGPMETDLPEDEQPSVASEPDVKPLESPAAPDKAEPDPSRPPQRRQQGGYECKYCPFSTQNLNAFKDHVDANHPNVILNPLYLCAVCNFNTKKFDTLTEHNERCHPGESNFKFKRIKLNNQTILEQTIEGFSNNAVIYNSTNGTTTKGEDTGSFPLSKSAAVKIGKPKITTTPDNNKWTESQLGKRTELVKKPITAVSVNGTVIFPETTLLKADGLSHIMPSLQRPPNYNQVPKIAVPLNTTKYNPSLDSNVTLMSSFNKFPYPTQAELSWLTAASKHPEDQIKVWFTTQRLKQGISWSPEEVEEARKKMFNGTIHSVPQTFTVVTSQFNAQSSYTTTFSKASQSVASLLQSLPCHLLGQTSLVLTPVANGSTVTCAPLALTVANQVAQSLKRPLPSPVVTTDTKRPSIIQTIHAPTASKMVSPKLLSFTVDVNKTAEQLSVLRASYTQCPFPEEDEIYRLIETTGLSRGEIKKWFSEQRLLNLKGAPPLPPPLLLKAEVTPVPKDGPVKTVVPCHFPLLERVKGKSSEQLKALEESFQRSSSPTEAELDQLVQETRLSKTEVDCWFSERRALRDNMEKARLTMAPTNAEERTDRGARLTMAPTNAEERTDRGARLTMAPANAEERTDRGALLLNGAAYPEPDGKALRSSPHPPVLSSSLCSSPHPPVLSSSLCSSPHPPILSSSLRSSPHPPVLSFSSSSSPPALSASSPHPPILSSSASPPILSSSSSSPHPPVLSASTSPDAIDSQSLTLLREVFCRTQWPTPEEYSQLEGQTGLGRTDIVRWFKDHRSVLKTGGTLDWMGGFQNQNPRQQNGNQVGSPEQNGQTSTSGSTERNQSAPQEAKTLKVLGVGEESGVKPAAAENSKLLNQDIVQWFTNKLGQSVADLSRTRPEQTSPNTADRGRWVKVTMEVGEENDGGVERERLATDSDILALEHPGRVTG